jgi:hypothetical protein
MGGLVASVLVSAVLKAGYTAAGIAFTPSAEAQFVQFDVLFTNMANTLHGLLIIFGADFFGQPAHRPLTVLALLNAAIVGVVVWLLWRSRRDEALVKKPQALWLRFVLLLAVGVLLVVTVSTISVGTSTYRYLVLLPYLAVLTLVLAPLGARRQKVVGVALLVSAVMSVGMMVVRPAVVIPGPVINRGNTDNFQLIAALEKRQLTKGYGQYWDASINTYLSGNRLTAVPVICGATDQTRPLRWLVAESQFTKPASRSFIVYDPLYADQGMCPPVKLIKQFGTPVEQFTVANKTVLVYDRDVLAGQ